MRKTTTPLFTPIACGLSLVVAACAGDLKGPDDDPMPMENSLIDSTVNDDGSTTSEVDAADEEAWVYFDLETSTEVMPEAPASSNDWDVAFRRFRVITNGGVNGQGGVEVARMGVVEFDGVQEAPADGYLTDADDGDDDGEIPDDAIHVGPSSETGPWAYNIDTHELSSSGEVFVVRSVEGNTFKLSFEEYYDGAGSPGHVRMRWAPLSGTLEPGVRLVSWGDGEALLSIENGVVEVDDPATSLDWDMALRLVGWKTNSGALRDGQAGAQLADTTDFDSITSAPTTGYTTDRSIPYPGPPGSPMFEGNATLTDWFIYDMTTHKATPRDAVFLVRGARGDYGKLQILAYDEPNKTYKLKLEPVARSVSVHTTTIDASDETSWVYLSLRHAEEIPADEAERTLWWDIAFSGTKVRTNSGTSGDGDGGSVAPLAAAFPEIVEAPDETYRPDEMLVDPADGVTMYSGNPILTEWWTTDMTTSEILPKDERYVVRTADGNYAKLQITGYTDGTYSIEWAYAGAQETTFSND